MHHQIGTLLPRRGARPKFVQLYIYDTDHEAQNRLGIFEIDDNASEQPDPDIVMSLLDMLDEHNQLVKAFRYARKRLENEGNEKFTLRCTSRSGLKILIENDDGSCGSQTRNVVYTEVLDAANAASA